MTCLVIQVLVVVADGLTETQRLSVEVTYAQREQQNHELRSPNLAMKNIAKDFWIDGWNCASSDYVHWSYNQVPKWEVLGSRVHRDELVLLFRYVGGETIKWLKVAKQPLTLTENTANTQQITTEIEEEVRTARYAYKVSEYYKGASSHQTMPNPLDTYISWNPFVGNQGVQHHRKAHPD